MIILTRGSWILNQIQTVTDVVSVCASRKQAEAAIILHIEIVFCLFVGVVQTVCQRNYTQHIMSLDESSTTRQYRISMNKKSFGKWLSGAPSSRLTVHADELVICSGASRLKPRAPLASNSRVGLGLGHSNLKHSKADVFQRLSLI